MASMSSVVESTVPGIWWIINTHTITDNFLCKKKAKEEKTKEGVIISALRHLSVSQSYWKTE